MNVHLSLVGDTLMVTDGAVLVASFSSDTATRSSEAAMRR
jgi:hypothetical protein